MNNFISIIIPCRNEERFIGKCLDSILEQDYPKDKIEVLVVDGISTDETKAVIKKFTQQYSFIKLLDNPRKFVPFALNKGINEAEGEVIIRFDAHAYYPPDYILKCVKYLYDYKVDNVGGVLITLPGLETLKAKAIALALSSPFGVGNSYFRIGVKEPKLVDTVPFGCYRREVFDKIGDFNENLIRNQDIEFNLRLKKAGGKILLVPNIKSYYYARSIFRELFISNFQNGLWVIYSTKFVRNAFSWRHLIPLVFVVSLIGSLAMSLINNLFLISWRLILGIYVLVNLSFSFNLKKRFLESLLLVIAFFVLHFSYGLGSLVGIFRLLITRGRQAKRVND
jgi:glycosyltransferase involved in cell wall biosynthesis